MQAKRNTYLVDLTNCIILYETFLVKCKHIILI